MPRISSALLLALLTGCPDQGQLKQEAQKSPPTPRKAAPELDQAMSSKAATMKEHFVRVGLIKTAIIHGQLDEAKKLAVALAKEQVEHPEDWAAQTKALREAATKLSEVADIEQAAIETGKLGAICGDCHQALEAGPKFEEIHARVVDELPHMRRHEWAINMMWDGLVGPSKERWMLGAAAFPKSPLTAESLDKNDAPPEGLAELEAAAHKLAEMAVRTETQQKRALALGSVLSTCAACHSRLKKPSPPQPE